MSTLRGIAKKKNVTNLITTTSTAALIDLIYPVGSIYISLSADFNPNNTWLGTTWTLIKDGYFLEATQTDGDVAKELLQSAPNITGYHSCCTHNTVGIGANGAFQLQNTGHRPGGSSYDGQYGININASRCDATYGRDGSKLRPNSVKCKMWQRNS